MRGLWRRAIHQTTTSRAPPAPEVYLEAASLKFQGSQFPDVIKGFNQTTQEVLKVRDQLYPPQVLDYVKYCADLQLMNENGFKIILGRLADLLTNPSPRRLVQLIKNFGNLRFAHASVADLLIPQVKTRLPDYIHSIGNLLEALYQLGPLFWDDLLIDGLATQLAIHQEKYSQSQLIQALERLSLFDFSFTDHPDLSSLLANLWAHPPPPVDPCSSTALAVLAYRLGESQVYEELIQSLKEVAHRQAGLLLKWLHFYGVDHPELLQEVVLNLSLADANQMCLYSRQLAELNVSGVPTLENECFQQLDVLDVPACLNLWVAHILTENPQASQVLEALRPFISRVDLTDLPVFINLLATSGETALAQRLSALALPKLPIVLQGTEYDPDSPFECRPFWGMHILVDATGQVTRYRHKASQYLSGLPTKMELMEEGLIRQTYALHLVDLHASP